MDFYILEKEQDIQNKGIFNVNTAYLVVDSWDDFGFKTLFHLIIFDEDGKKISLGNIKIGYKDQVGGYTYHNLEKSFDILPNNFFSLGQDIDFYVNLWKLSEKTKFYILNSLNDIAYNDNFFKIFHSEKVLSKSLMRSIPYKTINDQFKRIFEDKSPLTDYDFFFIRKEQEDIGGLELEFSVKADEYPSSNVHAIIGRNGVGKTTLLNGMIKSFLGESENKENFFQKQRSIFTELSDEYFGNLVAVSFSIFDPFIPNNKKYKKYSYIGLKESENKLKNTAEYFSNDFSPSFKNCYHFKAKRERWLTAIKNLESDNNFASMNLSRLMEDNWNPEKILRTIQKMSSGHASVLLIMTQLVSKVEEKTLVLLDEPETHLHPPLLSAFIRALSDLLDNRNGIAIIATHSPVVLQEIPKSCVWKIERSGIMTHAFRPKIETFGENVGILTKEVFGLEVMKSGFYNLLVKSVANGGDYEFILNKYKGQLGSEARFILQYLVHQEKKSYD